MRKSTKLVSMVNIVTLPVADFLGVTLTVLLV